MSATASSPNRPNIVIMVAGGILVSLVAIVFARLAYGLILPPMRDDLGLSYRQAGTLGTVTALGYLLFVLLGGIAASRPPWKKFMKKVSRISSRWWPSTSDEQPSSRAMR